MISIMTTMEKITMLRVITTMLSKTIRKSPKQLPKFPRKAGNRQNPVVKTRKSLMSFQTGTSSKVLLVKEFQVQLLM